MWGVVALTLDVSGLLCKYGDTPITQAGLLHVFKDLHIGSGKEGRRLATAAGWPPLGGSLPPEAQPQAEARGCTKPSVPQCWKNLTRLCSRLG